MAAIDPVLDEIRQRVGDDAESVAYLETHRLRYRTLLGHVASNITGLGRARILDIGPSYESELIRRLWPQAIVDSLGFLDGRLMPPRAGEEHTEFDLVQAADQASWPERQPYDLIVFAEVIEHLYISPGLVMQMLASLLGLGGTIIIQTPNAVALSRRFWLLMGRNPFESIRDDLHQAGHYREYTASELRDLCQQAGFRVKTVELQNYFLSGSRKNHLLVRLGPIVPRTLRQGITLTATTI